MRGLLIGNGLNLQICVEGLSNSRISERYFRNLQVYRPVIEYLLKIELPEDYEYLQQEKSNEGIESLLRIFNDFIESRRTEKSIAFENNLSDILQCICSTSIFCTDEGRIPSSYKRGKVPPVEKYNKVYSLNYYEFWDVKNIVTYLHGRVNYSALPTYGKVVILNPLWLNMDGFDDIVYSLEQKGYSVINMPLDIDVAPYGVDKGDLPNNRPLFPSNSLYPGATVFPNNGRDRYACLRDIEEVDVFGVSPDGEETLLNYLAKMKKVRAFIHKSNCEHEVIKWKESIQSSALELYDSEQIYDI